MKKTINYLAITSFFVLGTTLAYADSKSHADSKTSPETQQIDGSGSVINKMDDTGKDPKGKQRSTELSGDWDKQRDDAWHKKADSTWDKERDDAWHKAQKNVPGWDAPQSQQH